MTEQELRQLVRQAIASQRGPGRPGGPETAPVAFIREHLSHAQFGLPPADDGSCIIEPSVMCNHCGYCKSYGH